MGSVIFSICNSMYSAESGVKRVHIVLSVLRVRLLVYVHVFIYCRYDCMFAFAMFMLLCFHFMVMSSA